MIFCTHSDTSPPDADGSVICTRCGTTLPAQVLTEQLLRDAFECVRRDHGRLGKHSMRCVDTPQGWCCADDCTIR